MKYKIEQLPELERPRERLKRYGTAYLSNEELLAIIFRTGTKDKNVLDIAREVLITFPLETIDDTSIQKISAIKGVGEVKAVTLLAALELGKRSQSFVLKPKEQICNTKMAYELYHREFLLSKQEKLLAIFLDTKKKVICSKVLFIGTVNASTVHPRDIFREAVAANAVSIILMHNHPSNDVEPSYNDDFFTNKVVRLGKMMGIEVIDHIIVGNTRYYSYNEKWNEKNEEIENE